MARPPSPSFSRVNAFGFERWVGILPERPSPLDGTRPNYNHDLATARGDDHQGASSLRVGRMASLLLMTVGGHRATLGATLPGRPIGREVNDAS